MSLRQGFGFGWAPAGAPSLQRDLPLAAMGLSAQIPTIGGFFTPDILNNASFETVGNFDGFEDAAPPGDPSGSQFSQSTAQAFSGVRSLRFGFSNTGGDISAQAYYPLGSDRTHIWARTYFYQETAYPNGQGYKFDRFWNANKSHIIGVQILNNRFIWVSESPYSIIYISSGLPSLNAWHYLEQEVDITNRRARFWLDGAVMNSYQLWDPNPNNLYSFNGDWLEWSFSNQIVPRYFDMIRLINACTNSGAVYKDRVSLSSVGRIGP